MRPSILVARTLPFLGLVACAPDAEPGRAAEGTSVAVTAGHPVAAQAGLDVLRNGGNAMDAAITMAGVLSVARPHMNGLGGDMFLLYYDAASGQVYALNGSGRSGARATPAQLRAVAGDVPEMPETGPTSVSVPGAVGAWAAALERFGTIPFAEALAPAAQLAHNGLIVSQTLHDDIAAQREKLLADSVATQTFLRNGNPPEVGTILAFHPLGGTLDRLREQGPEEMYTGQTGQAIASYLSARGGFVTAADLAAYEPEWVEPITTDYRGLTVYAQPPSTQGVMLLELLALLGHFDLASLGHNAPHYFHVLAQAVAQAQADLDTTVADPAAMRVSVAQMLDADRLGTLAASIDPAGSRPRSALRVPRSDAPNTVAVMAVDSAGNAVSLIQSLFHAFGSGLVVPGTGIVLHNRGSLFSLDPAHPNVLAPGKRPFHTLCPALVFRDGRPWLVFGTPGGTGQTHTLSQVLNNILLFGMTPQEAIDAPRMRWYESRLAIEDRVPSDVLAALRERGYDVAARSGWTAEFGGAQAILIDGGRLIAGADRRREGWALAY